MTKEITEFRIHDARLLQLAALEYAANGATAKVIARNLDVTPAIINQQLDLLRLIMNAENRTHIIARAFSLGILTSAECGARVDWENIWSSVTKRQSGDIS